MIIGNATAVGPAGESSGAHGVGSDGFDGDIVGVSRQGIDVSPVAGEHRPSGLGEGHDEGIDGRSPSGLTSQLRRPASEGLGDAWFDDARLQEAVGVGVPSPVAP